jgi:hypothetical protein
MAFPTTGVLDNFNRADAATLGANWLEPQWPAQQAPKIVSNTVAFATGATQASSADWSTTVGPNCEVYVDVPTRGGDNISIWLRVNNRNSASITGYQFYVTGTNWQIWRIDSSSVFAQLGTGITQAVVAGDSIGAEAIGSALKMYYKPSGGSWTQKRSETDANHSTSGLLGLEIGNADGLTRLDNFAGGTVVVESHSGSGLLHGGGAHVGVVKKNAIATH